MALERTQKEEHSAIGLLTPLGTRRRCPIVGAVKSLHTSGKEFYKSMTGKKLSRRRARHLKEFPYRRTDN